MTEDAPFTAPTTAPENLVRVTGFELMTLFHVATTPEAQRTREALRLPPLEEGDNALAGALSSLVLRGMAEDQGGRLMPVGHLAALCEVLFTATRWIEAVGTTDDQRHAALVVVSPTGSALLESRPSGIWQALPLEEGASPMEAATGYVAASFGVLTARPFGGAVTVTTGDRAWTAGAKVDADDAWTLVHGPAEDVQGPTPVAADPTFRMLAEALQ